MNKEEILYKPRSINKEKIICNIKDAVSKLFEKKDNRNEKTYLSFGRFLDMFWIKWSFEYKLLSDILRA